MSPRPDLYRALDLVPTPVRIAGPDGALTFCNRAWLQLTGGTPDPQDGSDWAHLVHDDDRERYTSEYARAVRGGEPSSLSYRLRGHDGEYRHIRESLRPLTGEDGRSAGFVAT